MSLYSVAGLGGNCTETAGFPPQRSLPLGEADAAPIRLNDEAPRKPRGFRAAVQTRDMHPNVRYWTSFPAAKAYDVRYVA